MFSVSVNYAKEFPIITLKNDITTSNAVIFAFGAMLNEWNIVSKEGVFNVIDGFENPSEAMEEVREGFKSTFLSPFTCRMNRGAYTFNGHDFQVEKCFLGPHAIHGLVFENVCTISGIACNDHSASVTLLYEYLLEDVGYPFSYQFQHTWTLGFNNSLTVSTSVFHQNPFPIPYAQGWHPYFKLSNPVDQCSLRFDGEGLLEFDETLLPTGNILETAEFLQPRSMQGVSLDNCFQLNDYYPTCEFFDESFKITITPDASYPFLQIYTPPHRKSIAIENLSGAPDCFNNKIGLLELVPNVPVSFKTNYKVDIL